MNFIQTHWLELTILALFFIVAIIYIAWQIKKNGLRGTIINLIVEAEEKFEHGKNSDKFNYVYESIMKLLPPVLQVFITKAFVIDFIQKIFDEIKNALDYQKGE